jgi:hypothetical protein
VAGLEEVQGMGMLRNVVGLALVAGWIAAPAAARAETLLAENFDDGTADGFLVESGTWDVTGGMYHSRVDGFDVSAVSVTAITTLNHEWRDYRVEADVRADGSINHILRFRIQDETSYYQWNVRADPYNDAWLEKIVRGQHVVLATVPFANTPSAWHHLAVEAIGPNLAGFCDGQVLVSGVDTMGPPYLAGPIGVVAFSGGVIQWQDVYVDDVVVTTIEPVAMKATSWGALKRRF